MYILILYIRIMKGGVYLGNLGAWISLIGGVAAVSGQWMATGWLPAVGGIVAAVGAIITLAK